MRGVSLIGMPGCGKSTLGVLLAKELCLDFVDTDVLIQIRNHAGLQYLMDKYGYLRLREMEEEVLREIDAEGKVIATGGSAVYSVEGMAQLRRGSRTVYLQVELPVLVPRLGDFSQRGVAAPEGAGLEEIFAQREPLYQRYADLTMECGTESPKRLIAKLVDALRLDTGQRGGTVRG